MEPEWLCLLLRSGDWRKWRRVFQSTFVSPLPATTVALKETFCLYSALPQQGRSFTMKGTGVSQTAEGTNTQRRAVKLVRLWVSESNFHLCSLSDVLFSITLCSDETVLNSCPRSPLPFLSCTTLLGRLELSALCVSLLHFIYSFNWHVKCLCFLQAGLSFKNINTLYVVGWLYFCIHNVTI